MKLTLILAGAALLAGGAWQRRKSSSIPDIYFTSTALAAGFLLMLAAIMGWGCGENSC